MRPCRLVLWYVDLGHNSVTVISGIYNNYNCLACLMRWQHLQKWDDRRRWSSVLIKGAAVDEPIVVCPFASHFACLLIGIIINWTFAVSVCTWTNLTLPMWLLYLFHVSTVPIAANQTHSFTSRSHAMDNCNRHSALAHIFIRLPSRWTWLMWFFDKSNSSSTYNAHLFSWTFVNPFRATVLFWILTEMTSSSTGRILHKEQSIQ